MTLPVKTVSAYLCLNVRQPGECDRSFISNTMLYEVSSGLQLFWALSFSLISQFFVPTMKLAGVTGGRFLQKILTIKAQSKTRNEQRFYCRLIDSLNSLLVAKIHLMSGNNQATQKWWLRATQVNLLPKNNTLPLYH